MLPRKRQSSPPSSNATVQTSTRSCGATFWRNRSAGGCWKRLSAHSRRCCRFVGAAFELEICDQWEVIRREARQRRDRDLDTENAHPFADKNVIKAEQREAGWERGAMP